MIRLEFRAHHQRLRHGEEGLGQRGGIDQRQSAGQGQDLARRHRDILGISAAVAEGDDAVAGLERRDAFAHGRNLAGYLEAGHRGMAGRRVVPAAPLEQVGIVHAGRRDADQHLARFGLAAQALRGPEAPPARRNATISISIIRLLSGGPACPANLSALS